MTRQYQASSRWAWAAVASAVVAGAYTYLAIASNMSGSGDVNLRAEPGEVVWALRFGVAVWIVVGQMCAAFACSYRSLLKAEPRTGIAVLGALLAVALPIAALSIADRTHAGQLD